MNRIQKTFFTYVVYHEADERPVSLRHAAQEAYDGNMVGAVTNEHTEDVDPRSLADELKAIGNDGTFFDTDNEEN